jgi:hypothetical protein
MEAKTSDCVRKYIKEYYQNGLIGISDIASFCQIIEGELYKTLFEMELEKEIIIIKRYFCPEFHQIQVETRESYCEECDYIYSNEQIEVAIYIQPLISGALS